MKINPDKLVLLIEIAPELDPPIDHRALHRIASRDLKNFPEPKKEIGRHKYYDREELVEYYTLYKRANKNMGRKNGSR